jgi:hypothetical protein
MSEEYSGWSSYETWLVALWIDNDQGSYEYARELAKESREAAQEIYDDHQGCEGWDGWGFCKVHCVYTPSPAIVVADRMEEYVNDLVLPDSPASLANDLLGAALSDVDWHEIAEHYLEDDE